MNRITNEYGPLMDHIQIPMHSGVKKSGDGVNKNGDTTIGLNCKSVSIFVHPVPTFFHPGRTSPLSLRLLGSFLLLRKDPK